MEDRSNSNDLLDFEFNLGLVLFGKLSDLQKLKEILEKQNGITIRYQTLSRGKILVKREEES
jgi:hypothetical protein